MNKESTIGMVFLVWTTTISLPVLAETPSASSSSTNNSRSEMSAVEQDAAELHKRRMEYHKAMARSLELDKSEYQDLSGQSRLKIAKHAALPHMQNPPPFCLQQQLIKHPILQAGG